MIPDSLLFSFRPADVRLRKLAEEKDELLAQIRKLKNHLEEERQKHSKVDSSYTDGERMENGTDLHLIEMQSKLTWRTGKTTFEPRAHVLATLSVFFFSAGDANRQISEYKFKLSKAEQEIGTMEQNVSCQRSIPWYSYIKGEVCHIWTF